jgi:hypothetical protein
MVFEQDHAQHYADTRPCYTSVNRHIAQIRFKTLDWPSIHTRTKNMIELRTNHSAAVISSC